jgi:hypothetical protein
MLEKLLLFEFSEKSILLKIIILSNHMLGDYSWTFY